MTAEEIRPGARVLVLPSSSAGEAYEAVVLAYEPPFLVYLEGLRGAVHPARVRVLNLELGRPAAAPCGCPRPGAGHRAATECSADRSANTPRARAQPGGSLLGGAPWCWCRCHGMVRP